MATEVNDSGISADGQNMHPETALQARWRGRRLLVLDDDEVNRDVLVGLLAAVGIHADSAHDGARALALARTTSYDVVLMDILIPVMNGHEATRAIRQLPGYLTVRMIAISASARVEDRRRARNAGLDDFISKPYTARALYSTLLRWLPGSTLRTGFPMPAATCAAMCGWC